MKTHTYHFSITKILALAACLVCLPVIISGCGQGQNQNLASPTSTQTMVTQEATPAVANNDDESLVTPVVTDAVDATGGEEKQPTLTATPDVRLDPADWQNWPIAPPLSNRAKEIYLGGIAAGNDPHAFSKVGDCQSIREVLLGIYDLPGRYVLAGNDAYLLETVEQFAGSFNRDGYAVKGGYNAATVLSPFWADPEVRRWPARFGFIIPVSL